MKLFIRALKNNFLNLTILMCVVAAAGSSRAGSPVSAGEPGRIIVQAGRPGAEISPMFYGLMTEEINYSYEGGLYGELIQNRIFRDPPGGGVLPAAAGTEEPGLFRSEHYSMSAFSCKIPNGRYLAKLYFAETYSGIAGPGQRVFSLNVHGA